MRNAFWFETDFVHSLVSLFMPSLSYNLFLFAGQDSNPWSWLFWLPPRQLSKLFTSETNIMITSYIINTVVRYG